MLIILLLFIINSSATPLDLQELLNELSWSLRLKVLGEMNTSLPIPVSPAPRVEHAGKTIQQEASERRVGIESLVSRPENNPAVVREISANLAQVTSKRVGIEPLVNHQQNDLASVKKISANLAQDASKRRVGIESLVNRRQNDLAAAKTISAHLAQDASKRVSIKSLVNRRQSGPATVKEEISADENNMRLKLFRLMYETVRDSDLKVKRAELIQDRYTNHTAFQIGYLMGDVTDKFTIMTDISTTLNRFYGEWKPIEHINAYEQIANQAIEISHLIDLMRVANKRETSR